MEWKNSFRQTRSWLTGNPVRNNIVNSSMSREEGIKFFELDPAKKTVLVTGGSLGAKGLMKPLMQELRCLNQNDVQLIWQTGKPFLENAKEVAKGKKGIWVE